MTLEDLLARVRCIFEDRIIELRQTDKFKHVLNSLPADPEFYVEIARQHLSELESNYSQQPFEINLDTYYKFDQCCRELIYFDGRTFDACFFMLGWCLPRPKFTCDMGVNILASLKAGIIRGRLGSTDKMKLIQLLTSCLDHSCLKHNATGCLKRLKEMG